MNSNDYRNAMDRIVPSRELKGRILRQNTSQRRYLPVRRVLTGALAAVLTLSCLFTIAMAASPELRLAVLSFLRMEEREQVPSDGTVNDEPDISRVDIGELVKAQYIKMDRRYGYSGSLLTDLTWSEDHRTLLDAKFWEVQDNELIPVDVGLNTEKVDLTFRGSQYQGELYWYIQDCELVAFKGNPHSLDIRPEDQWYVSTIPGRTDAVWIRLYRGSQLDYSEYPVLYHIGTGEVEDILLGIDVTEPGLAYEFDWSEDMRRVLILYHAYPEEQQTWVGDLDAGTLTLLEDLTGVEAEYANFLDTDTLILTAYGVDEEDTWTSMTAWTYGVSSGQTVKTLDQLPYYRWWDEAPYGVMPYGKTCLYVSETGQVDLIDLMTGERIPVEGFTYQKGDRFMVSPSQNKLLYYHADPEADGLGIAQLGVVDLEKRIFIAFDRDGYLDLHEESIGWSSDNTVSINATASDGETRYLILYTF